MAQRPDDLPDAPEGLASDDPKTVSPLAFHEADQYGHGDDDWLVIDISERSADPSSDHVRSDPTIDPDQTITAIIARLAVRSKSKAHPSGSDRRSSPFARSRLFARPAQGLRFTTLLHAGSEELVPNVSREEFGAAPGADLRWSSRCRRDLGRRRKRLQV